jgi:hypothetical protein
MEEAKQGGGGQRMDLPDAVDWALVGDASMQQQIAKRKRLEVVNANIATAADRLRAQIARGGATQALGWVMNIFGGEGNFTEGQKRGFAEILSMPNTKSFLNLAICVAGRHMGSKKFGSADPTNNQEAAIVDASVNRLEAYASDITAFSAISKSGQVFKTIRIAKALLRIPRPASIRSGIMTLIQIANTMWTTLFPGIRPNGLFIQAMLAYFKSMVGVDSLMTLSPNKVRAVITSLAENHPKVLQLYFLKKEGSAAAREATETARANARGLKDRVASAIDKVAGDPAKVMAIIGDLFMSIDANTAIDTTSISATATRLLSTLPTGESSKFSAKGKYYTDIASSNLVGGGAKLGAVSLSQAKSMAAQAGTVLTDTAIQVLRNQLDTQIRAGRTGATRGSLTRLYNLIEQSEDKTRTTAMTQAEITELGKNIEEAKNTAIEGEIALANLKLTQQGQQPLSEDGRKAIANYIMSRGLKPEALLGRPEYRPGGAESALIFPERRGGMAKEIEAFLT